MVVSHYRKPPNISPPQFFFNGLDLILLKGIGGGSSQAILFRFGRKKSEKNREKNREQKIDFFFEFLGWGLLEGAGYCA